MKELVLPQPGKYDKYTTAKPYFIDRDGVIYEVNKENQRLKQLKIHGYISYSRSYRVYIQTLNIISNKIKKQTFQLHRIVAHNLVQNPENKKLVVHIDGNKRNNHPSNLKWINWIDMKYHKDSLIK